MKTLLILFVILLTTAALATAGITTKDSLDLGKSGEDVKAGVQTICIDSLKFVYAYGWAAKGTSRGIGAGGGVSIIQVYEEKDGKVVPARCN